MNSIIDALLKNQEDFVLLPETIQRRCRKFEVGDLVRIPGSYLESRKDEVVTVDLICTHHIVFQFKTGIKRSFIKFDCMNFELVKSAHLRDFQTFKK